MAQKVTVTLIDDLEADGTTLADQTVQFGLDGKVHELDLSDDNAKKLREFLDRYIAVSRKPGSSPKAARASQPANREDTQAIRTWARENNWEVADRGRIPVEVREAYEQR